MAGVNVPIAIVLAIILGTCAMPTSALNYTTARNLTICFKNSFPSCLIIMPIAVCTTKCVHDCLYPSPPPPAALPLPTAPPPPAAPPLPTTPPPPGAKSNSNTDESRECIISCATSKCTYIRTNDQSREEVLANCVKACSAACNIT